MKPLTELRAIAEKATPGPFEIERRDWDDGAINYIVYGAGDVAWCIDDLDRKAKFNAAHIAAFNPQTCLALLDDIDRMREALEVFTEAITDDGCGGYFWRDAGIVDAVPFAREALAGLKVGKGGEGK